MITGRSARSLRNSTASASPRPSGNPTSTRANASGAAPAQISSAAFELGYQTLEAATSKAALEICAGAAPLAFALVDDRERGHQRLVLDQQDFPFPAQRHLLPQ